MCSSILLSIPAIWGTRKDQTPIRRAFHMIVHRSSPFWLFLLIDGSPMQFIPTKEISLRRYICIKVLHPMRNLAHSVWPISVGRALAYIGILDPFLSPPDHTDRTCNIAISARWVHKVVHIERSDCGGPSGIVLVGRPAGDSR